MIKNKNIKKAVKKVANKNRIILVIIKINNLEEIQDLVETFEENIDAICIYDSDTIKINSSVIDTNSLSNSKINVKK